MRKVLLLVGAVGLISALGVRGDDAKSPTTEPNHGQDARATSVTFNRDIRPIFSDTCFKCHGPDERARKGKLRLDTFEGATAKREKSTPILPRKPDESEAYRRISSTDADEVMPPAKSGMKLTAAQKEAVRKWIEQGAQYQPHWSFLAPKRPDLPAVKNEGWVKNPIDNFILARLESENLSPSPETDNAKLLRRASLDLTGLPPTAGELDTFLNDRSPDAYEKAVDRLLASPRYGERMTMQWLDAARYADTNGYQGDAERFMYQWREWVINAFNANKPFDVFVTEQLAGDLLPKPTLEQRVATGFVRNNRTSEEGGIIPEEMRMEYTIDRVETVATTFMGLTMGCCRCHDHKYDPISQKDFYQFLAFFNTMKEEVAGFRKETPPLLKFPTAEQARRLAEIDTTEKDLRGQMEKTEPELAAAQEKWEKKVRAEIEKFKPADGLVAHFPFNGDLKDRVKPERAAKHTDDGDSYEEGIAGKAASTGTEHYIDAGDLARFNKRDKFSIALWVYPQPPSSGALLSRMDDPKAYHGYDLHLLQKKIQFQLIDHWPDNAIHVETAWPPIDGEIWHHIVATYDGSAKASGARIYVSGKLAQLKTTHDSLKGDFDVGGPFLVGSRRTGETLRARIEDLRIYDRVLGEDEILALAAEHRVGSILHTDPAKRTEPQAKLLREFFRGTEPLRDYADVQKQLHDIRTERKKIEDSMPKMMVVEEMEKPRDTFILKRGQYDQPGEKVRPAIPAVLPPLAKDLPVNRLGLAKWLTSPEHPLTARVSVNRFWQMYFGTGLVKTTENFGSQAEWPSHPELLDWLATEFIRSGWDVKAMQKLIVTSATYRQSSKLTPALLEKDPENRLLARGPRMRLQAELIRDQALFVSGLLVEKIGGKSVKPYQPPGLWEELNTNPNVKYVESKGDDLYRRGMYTFWKRTVPPPMMTTFDAPSREICTVNRSRTNTPLQALALLNDTTYVEASRHFAVRVMKEGGETPAERIALAFRLATSRAPSAEEARVLLNGFEKHLAKYREDKAAAKKLVSAGESRRDEQFDVSELAAYTATMSVILNLDETITKE